MRVVMPHVRRRLPHELMVVRGTCGEQGVVRCDVMSHGRMGPNAKERMAPHPLAAATPLTQHTSNTSQPPPAQAATAVSPHHIQHTSAPVLMQLTPVAQGVCGEGGGHTQQCGHRPAVSSGGGAGRGGARLRQLHRRARQARQQEHGCVCVWGGYFSRDLVGFQQVLIRGQTGFGRG